MTPRSFLPQIVGLFYATFDPTFGPIILHQVPDNLISNSSDDSHSRSRSVSRSRLSSSPLPPPKPASHSASYSSTSTSNTNPNSTSLSTASSTSTATSTSISTMVGRVESEGNDRGRGSFRARDGDGKEEVDELRRGRSRSRYLNYPNNRPLPSSPNRSSPHSHSNGKIINVNGHSSTQLSNSTSHLQPHSRSLLDFALISEYIIPKKSLHGKLVTFLATGDDDERYRVMGFPSVLEGEGDKYQRNEYMWNLCFVFAAESSLEAFEPVVRKSARILRSAEIDSGYLSSPKPQHTSLPAVLEQIFEDLNSYSETSIPLDGFNSLELKLFPFFPNPPDCHDWDVPIALVDFNDLKDDNWDITAARVSQYINGVNHVRKIAELADADAALTRETLRHMMYYQVIMMIDIFQYSNIYALEPSFKRLASDESVIRECGDYVTRPGFDPPCWPILCGLYARLTPGITVHEWIEENDILSMGIDPRRFTSFGVIKGFLRRVHRWPIVLNKNMPLPQLFDQPEHRHHLHRQQSGNGHMSSGAATSSRRRVGFRGNDSSKGDSAFSSRPTLAHQNTSGLTTADSLISGVYHINSSHNFPGESVFTMRSVDSNNNSLGVSPSSANHRTPPSNPSRSPGPSFSYYLRRGGNNANGGGDAGITLLTTRDSASRSLNSAGDTLPSVSSRRGGGGGGDAGDAVGRGMDGNGTGVYSRETNMTMSGRATATSGMLTVSSHSRAEGPNGSSGFNGGGGGVLSFGIGLTVAETSDYVRLAIEDELGKMLDGNHHADEIQVKFGMGWNELERVIGVEGSKGGVGRKGIAVIYR